MKNIKACILAGGRGVRFRPYTEIVPKPMIPIGPEEKPLLEHIILWIKKYGIEDFILLVGYKWKQIRNYFGFGEKLGVKINYSIDEEPYGDTGGSLLLAYKRGLLNKETLLIWYGDIIAPLNIHDMIKAYEKKDPDALVVVTKKYKVPVGVAELRGDDIIDLKEKPWINIHATIGILMLKTSIFDEIEKVLGTKFDIMGDLIPWLIREKYRVKAYIYDGLWYDIGSLERYKKFDHNKLLEFFQDY